MANITVNAAVHSLLNSGGNLTTSTNALGTLGAPVTGASIATKLVGTEIQVASIKLNDATGLSLPVGSLSLNSSNQIVIHDADSNTENLPHLVDSLNNTVIASRILAASMDNVNFSLKLADIPLPASALTNGKNLFLTGSTYTTWGSGNKPSDGVFLGICKQGQDPITDGFIFNFAEGVTSEDRRFGVALQFIVSAGVWTLSSLENRPTAHISKNSSGTITHAAGWTYGADWLENSPITGTAGNPVNLNLYIITIDSSDNVTASLVVSGSFSVISR